MRRLLQYWFDLPLTSFGILSLLCEDLLASKDILKYYPVLATHCVGIPRDMSPNRFIACLNTAELGGMIAIIKSSLCPLVTIAF